MNSKKSLIVVDSEDNELGIEEKITVHRNHLLHRAFSIMIYNLNDELLIQRRALSKYHSSGLWGNTCCSHSYKGKSIVDIAKDRLYEEMGFSCDLFKTNTILYHLNLDNNMYEYEYVHVFSGYYNGPIHINSDEVSEYKWRSLEFLKNDIIVNKSIYARWLRLYLLKYYDDIFLRSNLRRH